MNILRTFVMAVGAAALLSACTGKVSEVTNIKGTVIPEGITEVRVAVENGLDTIVPVTDGKFALDIPASKAFLGRIAAGDKGTDFISDGTPLTVVINDESSVVSKYPKISVQERMNTYLKERKELMDEYMAAKDEIFADSLLTKEEKDAKFEQFCDTFIPAYNDYSMKVFSENTDNAVSVLALYEFFYECEDSELDSLLNLLSPEIQGQRFIAKTRKSIAARAETGAGKMFKDFTVNTVVGQTRSVPPQPKYAEVKFSDYVGKGKYVLVDFWSPWCGPCRREMPNIKAVYDKYKGDDFDVLSIAVWERQPVDVTIETAAKLGMDWNQINNAGSVPTEIYGIDGIPHLMLIAPDGTILERGFHGLEGIESAVSKYIK